MALQANILLLQQGYPCLLQDLWIVLAKLSEPVSLPSNFLTANNETFKELAAHVARIAGRQLSREIHASERVYLLHHRLEPQEEGPSRRIHRTLQHYLTQIHSPAHRKSVTWLLLGQHIFASERLRWVNTPVPWDNRLCRHCCMHVETPEHALLQCVFDKDLVALRYSFREELASRSSTEIPISLTDDDDLELLKTIIFNWKLIPFAAKFIHDTTTLWNTTQLYRLPVSNNS